MKIPEWFELMFLTNQWGWFHALGGLVIAKALVWAGVPYDRIVVSILVMAIVWELLELFMLVGAMPVNGMETLNKAIVSVYGSWYGWAMDSLGDVVVAVFAAMVVAL